MGDAKTDEKLINAAIEIGMILDSKFSPSERCIILGKLLLVSARIVKNSENQGNESPKNVLVINHEESIRILINVSAEQQTVH